MGMGRDLRMELSRSACRALDASVEAVAARADELARRWAVALIRGRPLDELGGISLEAIARDAPVLCAHVVRALESEDELEQLTESGTGGDRTPPKPARLGALVARNASESVEEVEALRGVIWEALMEELRWPSSDSSAVRRLSDLSDRLAYVCATALAATLAEIPAGGVREPDRAPSAKPQPAAAGRPEPAPAGRTVSATAGRVVAPSAERRASTRTAVLVDEWMDGAAASPAARFEAARIPAAQRTEGRPRPWDIPLHDERAEGGQPGAGGRGGRRG
jgi:hypothetical protein